MSIGVCGYIEVDGVKYWKPNMASIDGELGRRIAEHIRKTPPPDFTEIDAEVARINERIRKAKEDGTF